jgi:hypothetical protein
MNVYIIPLRIRKIYFDLIKAHEKKCEIRRCSPFWDKRMNKAKEHLLGGNTVIASLLCGHTTLRLEVEKITLHMTPYEVLNREPSQQGLIDIGTGPVWAIWFGEEGRS